MKSIFLFLSLIALQAGANEVYFCKHGEQERKIEVVYADESGLPCEVQYTKEGEEPRTLWNANNEEGYCDSKAKAFVEKQESWGWLCALSPETTAD